MLLDRAVINSGPLVALMLSADGCAFARKQQIDRP